MSDTPKEQPKPVENTPAPKKPNKPQFIQRLFGHPKCGGCK